MDTQVFRAARVTLSPRASGFMLAVTLILCATLAAGAHSQSAPAERKTDFDSWWRHVTVLSDDAMEGRETGTPGFKRAAEYVVQELQKSGARPGLSSGYYQNVPFLKRSVDENRSSLQLTSGSQTETLRLGEDAIFSAGAELGARVKAPLVFVGYGLQIPELGYDDLSGLPLRGAVVVYVNGAPSEVPSTLAAVYQSAGLRWSALKRAGAVGAIAILNPATTEVPWPRLVVNNRQPSLVLAAGLNELAGQKLSLNWNPAHAEKLFAGTDYRWQQLSALARERKRLPRFALAKRIDATARGISAAVNCTNVVAVLPGTDERLRDEYVVVSAHLDHLGTNPAASGDSIFNGAIDNASGVATVLEIAHTLKEAKGLRRSVLFVLFTGEEKGLLGSSYFVARSPVPLQRIIANVNIDNFKPIVPLKLLTVIGLGESDLADSLGRAAREKGVGVEDDPTPSLNRFIRSDQFSFVRRGIPGVNIHVGAARGSAEYETLQRWGRERYHTPSDDTSQPIDFAAARLHFEIVQALVIDLANSDRVPTWKQDSAFRTLAGQK